MSAVSEELGISMSAMTQIADRMERSGLVQRAAGVEDRRVKHLQLTERGREMMRTRRALRVSRAAEVLAALAPAERDEILGAFHKLLAAAEAAPHTGSAVAALAHESTTQKE